MKENQTSLKLISEFSSPTNTDGIPRISSSTDSELLSEVTDPLDSASLMTTNNTWSSTNQTSDWDNWPFSPREIQREKPRNNLKEKLKKPEVPKRLKSLPPEKSKPRPTLEEPRKSTSRKSSLDFVYSIHTFAFYISINFYIPMNFLSHQFN